MENMRKMDPTLAVVIPAHNESGQVLPAAEKIAGLLAEAGIGYCLIFVDDGSKDQTWQEILEAGRKDVRVEGIRLSRNFGKEAAIYAGLEAAADAACAAVMDCDLQHPPEKLVEMYRLWEQGYEIVEGVKSDRGKESLLHKGFSLTFYRLISEAVGIDIRSSSDFKLMDRKVVSVLLSIREKNTFFRAMTYWTGFKMAKVSFEVQERTGGRSSWSGLQLVKYAFSNITSFSTAPMQLVTFMGVIMLILTILQGIEALVSFLGGRAAEGFTTVILLQLFIGSITMLSLGIIGYYIGKIYIEVKGRPRYVVSESTRKTEEE